MDSNPLTSRTLTYVIPYRNGASTLPRLLSSLPARAQVIVIDDLSDNAPVPFQDYTDAKGREIRVLHPEVRGYFAGASNLGINACKTDVLILNQDVYFEGDQWQTLLKEWQSAGYGIAGDGVFGHPAFPKGYVQGTCMYLSRGAINAVGLLNADEYPLWGCTAEYQLRIARAGFQPYPTSLVGVGFKHERGSKPFGTSIAKTLDEEPEKRNLFIKTPPTISVIITNRNYGRFLTDAVNSLIGGETSLGKFQPQTYASFEVVIVDDASTDDSVQIARALADANVWKGVRFLPLKEHVGSARAMNLGIAASYGKWLTPLDADDMMEPTRLGVMLKSAEANPHSVVYDDITGFAETPSLLEIMGLGIERRPRTEERQAMWTVAYGMPPYDFEKILVKNGMHKGIFFSRDAFQETGGYPERFSDGREDWAMNVALGLKGYCGVHVEQPLYLHRRHSHNRTNTNGHREWRQHFIDRMEAEFPAVYLNGERPPMCCGRKSNTNGNGNGGQQRFAAAAAGQGNQMGGLRAMAGNQIGREGMTLVRYNGGGSGSVPFWGAVTHKQYVFGGDRLKGFVDNRDLPALLKLVEAGRALFERAPIVVPENAQPQVGGAVAPVTAGRGNLLPDFGPNARSGSETTVIAKTNLLVSADGILILPPLPGSDGELAQGIVGANNNHAGTDVTHSTPVSETSNIPPLDGEGDGSAVKKSGARKAARAGAGARQKTTKSTKRA